MTGRSIDADPKSEIGKTKVFRCLLVELRFDGGTQYLTNGPKDIDWNGNTYLSGNLHGVTGIGEALDLQNADVTVQLSGVNQANLATALSENYIDRAVAVYEAILSPGENLFLNSSKFDAAEWVLGLRSPTVSLAAGVGPSGEDAYRIDIPSGAGPEVDASIQQQIAAPLDPATMASQSWFLRAVDSPCTIAIKMGRNSWWSNEVEIGMQWQRYSDSYIGAGSTAEFFGLVARQSAALSIYMLSARLKRGYDDGQDIITTSLASPPQGELLGSPILKYLGYIDHWNFTEDPSNGSSLIEWHVSDQTVKFDQISGYAMTDAAHQARYPGDKFFEFAGQVNTNIPWGRKQ